MALRDDDFGLWLINFDPEAPQASLFASPTDAMLAAETTVRPVAVPWPAAWSPRAQAITPAPQDSDPLPKRDVLVVTWTAGEAQTFAQLVTGGNFEDWYAYRHNVAAFIPKVTGGRAPFNDNTPSMKRYYHTLGLYFPFTLGKLSAIVFKSGLHMAYDGPDVPLVDLWKQLIAEVQPKLVITTGTGGGIGKDVLLGDVVLSSAVRFHLTGTLKAKPYAETAYPSPPLPYAQIEPLVSQTLLKPNGNLLQTPRVPRVVAPPAPLDTIVSTDTFAFDETTDHFGLEALGSCCDMGDATLGLALSQAAGSVPAWVAIRNASDPQIPNPDNKLEAAKQLAEQIYGKYQMITTAGSVIVSLATMLASIPGASLSEAEAAAANLAAPPAPPAAPRDDPQRVLLLLAASSALSRATVAAAAIEPASLAALQAELAARNVRFDQAALAASSVRFTDVNQGEHHLYSVDVTGGADAPAFAATYVLSHGTIVAKYEMDRR
jgi:nucleoside phosphorylase